MDSEKLESTSVPNKITYLLKHIENIKVRNILSFGSLLKLKNPTIFFLYTTLLIDKLVCKFQLLVCKILVNYNVNVPCVFMLLYNLT